MGTIIPCCKAATGITGTQPRARSTSVVTPCKREGMQAETAAMRTAVLPARETTGSEGWAGTGP